MSPAHPFPVYSIIDGRAVTPCTDLAHMADLILDQLAGRKLALVPSQLDIGDGRGVLVPVIAVLFRPRGDAGAPDGRVCLTGAGEGVRELRAAIEAAIQRRRATAARASA